jgi:hypothetical protein
MMALSLMLLSAMAFWTSDSTFLPVPLAASTPIRLVYFVPMVEAARFEMTSMLTDMVGHRTTTLFWCLGLDDFGHVEGEEAVDVEHEAVLVADGTGGRTWNSEGFDHSIVGEYCALRGDEKVPQFLGRAGDLDGGLDGQGFQTGRPLIPALFKTLHECHGWSVPPHASRRGQFGQLGINLSRLCWFLAK